jgi:GntR family transcriptional regulator
VPLTPGPVPLYHQIVADLRKHVGRRKLKPGDLLPTEEQLCRQYGVSRITVRRAVDDLIVEGLVVRRRGVGTFVAEPHAASRSVGLTGSLFDALAYPRDLVIEHRAQAERRPVKRIAEALRLGPRDKAVEWEVLSRVGATPFAATTFSFPLAIGRELDPRALRADTPAARLVERVVGESVVRAEQTVEPESTDAALSRLLEIPPRTAVLRVTRTYFTSSGKPVECATVHYRPDQYRLRVELRES